MSAGLVGCGTHYGHRESCKVKALEVEGETLQHNRYIALCEDTAGRKGVVVFKEPVTLGQMVSFTPYQVDPDTQTYYGYLNK